MIDRFDTIVSSPSGAPLAVDRRKLMEVPYFLMTNPTQNIVQLPANGSVAGVMCNVSSDGPAEVIAHSAESTGEYTVVMRIRDGVESRQICNAPIHNLLIAGNNLTPYRLPESLLIDEMRGLEIDFADLSGSTNNVRFVSQAVRYLEIMDDPKAERLRVRMRRRQHLSYPYYYGFEGVGHARLAAGAAGNFPISIGEDHFEMMTLAYWGRQGQNIDLQIIDVTRGEPLIDAFGGDYYAINARLLAFDARFCYRLCEPRMLMGGSKLVVQVRNNEALQNDIYICLGGRALAHRIIKEQ